MPAPPSRAKVLGVLAFIAVSTPLAMLIETGLRKLMFPPVFDEVRMWLRPTITPWMWLAPAACALAVPLAFKLQRWLVDRDLAQLSAERRTLAERAAAEFDALVLSSSAPQLPAVLSTFGFMFGSEITPVLAAMLVSTSGVLWLGVKVARSIPRDDAPPNTDPPTL